MRHWLGSSPPRRRGGQRESLHRDRENLPADCRHSFHTTNTDLNKPTVKLQNSNTHERM
jgi:hypothetical protein